MINFDKKKKRFNGYIILSLKNKIYFFIIEN